MSKRRNLNGLPNILTQRFFSTLFYFDGGYMSDWIWEIAFKYKAKNFRINILTGEFEPHEIKCHPIEYQLELLRTDISKSLKRENFEKDFVKEAYFLVGIPEQYVALRMISCQAVIVDNEGKKNIGKVYTERSFGLHSTSNSNLSVSKKGESIFSKFAKWLSV